MSDDWNVYRTRFLVRAKQLTEFVEFYDPLGRHHTGTPGAYLVHSSEGLLRIAAREIFEDVYVRLAENAPPSFSSGDGRSFSTGHNRSFSPTELLPS
jgi:hypothetical protein